MFGNELDNRLPCTTVDDIRLQYLTPKLPLSVPLEMHIHLINGNMLRFVQPDVEAAICLLSGIQPQRLFRKPQIVLSSEDSLTTIPTSAVEQIDFSLSEIPLDWALPSGIKDIVEFSPDALTGSEDTGLYSEFELRSGRIVYLHATAFAGEGHRLPVDSGIAASHFLERAVVCGRRAGGGVFLLNPANVFRFTAYDNSAAVAPATMSVFSGRAKAMFATGVLPAGYCYS